MSRDSVTCKLVGPVQPPYIENVLFFHVYQPQVFQKVAEEKKGKVHVFYCGAPALAKLIKAQCEHFGFNFYKENF